MTMTTSKSPPSEGGDTVQNFQEFVLEEIPRLNEQVAAGQSCPYQFSAKIKAIMTLEVIAYATNPYLSEGKAVELLKAFSVCVSSVAKHLSDFSIKRSPFDLLGGDVEKALLNLAKITGLPPRDSHYTTWLLNDPERPYRFDSNSGWDFFHRAVRLTDSQNRLAVGNLGVICEGFVGIDSEAACELLMAAWTCIKVIFDFQATFTKRSAVDGKANMEPSYFMNSFRTYFLTYVVGNQELGGTNAANVASCAAIDVRMGLKDEQYIQTIRQRFRYYSPSDREYMNKMLVTPSIMDKFAEALGVPSEQLMSMTNVELDEFINASTISPALQKSFEVFSDLVNMTGRLTRLHFGLIDRYLVKEFEKQQAECPLGFSGKLAVSHLQGTGGASHEDTKRIRDMRLYHPLFERLSSIFRSI